jgi:hypothetical protein
MITIIIAFAIGFYFGVLLMSLLAIRNKTEATKAVVFDAAA